MRKAMLALFLVFSTLFISVGYAALARDIRVTGTVDAAAPPRGLFITHVEVVEEYRAEDVGTNYTSPTNLRSVVVAQSGGRITYRVTVENNSDMTYWFRDILYMPDMEGTSNALIGSSTGVQMMTKDKLTDTTATFNENDWVPPNTTRDFYVVYSFGASAVGKTVTTFVNYSFGNRLTSYADEFLALLNDPERYPILADAFNDMYRKNGTTVVSNTGADVALFDALLGQNLMLDGKPVKIIVDRRNVDGKSTTGDAYSPNGPTACEYTLYLTTENLSGSTTVYAVSYTREPSGEWVQIGELYEGTAPLSTYLDSTGEAYYAPYIDQWVATRKTYTVFTYNGRAVTYKVNERYGNSFQQQYTLTDLMSMQDQELFNQLNNHQILKDIYKILFVEHPDSVAPEILLLREAYQNALRYYTMRNNGQEFQLDNKATRAELLSTVEALARAMEYYQQVHDTSHS